MISESDAVDIAREAAEQNGWEWLNHTSVTLVPLWPRKGHRWIVESTGVRCGVEVLIDAETGAVIDVTGHLRRANR